MLVLFWSGQGVTWFNQFAWAACSLFGDIILYFSLSYLAICSAAPLLCPMLKIDWRKTLIYTAVGISMVNK